MVNTATHHCTLNSLLRIVTTWTTDIAILCFCCMLINRFPEHFFAVLVASAICDGRRSLSMRPTWLAVPVWVWLQYVLARVCARVTRVSLLAPATLCFLCSPSLFSDYVVQPPAALAITFYYSVPLYVKSIRVNWRVQIEIGDCYVSKNERDISIGVKKQKHKTETKTYSLQIPCVKVPWLCL